MLGTILEQSMPMTQSKIIEHLLTFSKKTLDISKIIEHLLTYLAKNAGYYLPNFTFFIFSWLLAIFNIKNAFKSFK